MKKKNEMKKIINVEENDNVENEKASEEEMMKIINEIMK